MPMVTNKLWIALNCSSFIMRRQLFANAAIAASRVALIAMSRSAYRADLEKAPAENRGATALSDHSLSQKCSCPVCASSKMTSATIATPRSAPNAIISWRALNIR